MSLLKMKSNTNILKEIFLNEFQEITKNDGTPFKVFSPFWRNAEQKYLELPPIKNYTIKKKSKEIFFF